MPEIRVQDEQGNIHVFPDGSTPEMISKAMGVKPPSDAQAQPDPSAFYPHQAGQSQASVSAQPKGVLPWLNNLESDVRYGGTSTLPGQLLHAMGAKGINVGSQSQGGETLMSPITGPIHAAQGVAMTPSHPISGPMKAAGGALEAASIPAMFAVGPESQVASTVKNVASGAADAAKGAGHGFLQTMGIPNRAHAGQLFQEAMGAAKDVPIDVTAPGNTALQMQDFAGRGGRMPKVVRDFIKRTTDPSLPPMTYQEARDFYSNASQLSSEESFALKPRVKQMLGQFVSDLGKSVQGAANQAGVGEQYGGAMKEYATASKASDAMGSIVEQIKQKLPWLATAAVADKFARSVISSK